MRRLGDIDGAIELARITSDTYFRSGELMWLGAATAVLVESLLQRGSEADVREARTAIAKLAALPLEPGAVIYDVWLLRLRALLAHTVGDSVRYRDLRDRYRDMARELGFEGHLAWAEAMT